MGVYDQDAQKVVVRVVYDGPAMAGKTTNVEQLASFFTLRRRTELFRGGETHSKRTLYMEWMQLDSGLVQGYGLRCHLITVPGQAVLFPRRKQLVEKADAVVFVMEATKEGVEEARPAWESLHRIFESNSRPIPPCVVQANKQDASNRISDDEVRRGLGVPEHVPIIGAEARAGGGVRESLVLALRAAADIVQKQLVASGIESMAGTYQSAQEILEEMQAAELRTPRSAVEAALMRTELVATPRVPASSIATEGNEGGSRVPSAPPTPPHANPAVREVPRVNAQGPSVPPFPDPSVAAGLVWPASSGRDVLRRIPFGEARRREELAVRHGAGDSSARTEALIYEAGLWCLKTSYRRRFVDVDSARAALLKLARLKGQLGELLLPQTTLTVRAAPDGTAWLWTVGPWVETLRSRMTYGAKHGDDETLGDALSRYAEAAFSSLRLTLESQMVLDVEPRNFGLIGDRLFHLDDDISTGPDAPGIGYALLSRADEYHQRPRCIRRYANRLRELLLELTPEEIHRLSLKKALTETIVRTPAARAMRGTLLDVLDRTGFVGAVSG